jgi:hypothetical protein
MRIAVKSTLGTLLEGETRINTVPGDEGYLKRVTGQWRTLVGRRRVAWGESSGRTGTTSSIETGTKAIEVRKEENGGRGEDEGDHNAGGGTAGH